MTTDTNPGAQNAGNATMTLTPEQIADGWLPHDGGPCPVPLDSKPGIITECGKVSQPGWHAASVWAGPGDWWKHHSSDPMHRIIAYKPEPRP